MTSTLTAHLRVFEPHPGILAFYDGRVPGQRFMPGPNWVDAGALSLGIASYAIISGDQALVYDTHVTLSHAMAIRAALVRRGVTRITVVLSHWHKDHIAGTAAFADCPVIATRKTAAHMATRKAGIESGLIRPPAINPLILPDITYDGALYLTVGAFEVQLIEVNIHSDDATVLWLPQIGVLLAGDTVEDCCTFVAEPENLDLHLAGLDRLIALDALCILPNHGAPDQIAAGGYEAAILFATQTYIRWLQHAAFDSGLAQLTLDQVIADDLRAGILHWFEPYAEIHRLNVHSVVAAAVASD